jgi:hypothetical protein
VTGLSIHRFPATPIPGLVFRYPYLFKSESEKGLTQGLKRRPCVVVVRYGPVTALGGHYAVDVAAISHSPQDGSAVKIPLHVKSRMGLDDDVSWIVTSEMNRFVWPGPDFLPAYEETDDRTKRWHWGVLPQDIFKRVLAEILEARANKENVIRRPSM